jgi:hypothetical protein
VPAVTYSEKVLLRNPKSGAVKQIKVGWSWTIFFFDWLALFVRGMYPWSALFMVFFIANILLRSNMAIIPLLIIELGVKVYLCVKGNELMAKQHLENGWEFAEPDAEATRHARSQWGLAPSTASHAAIRPVLTSMPSSSGDSVAGNVTAGIANEKEINLLSAYGLFAVFAIVIIFIILIVYCA